MPGPARTDSATTNPCSMLLVDEDLKRWTAKDRICFSIAYATYHSIWLACFFKQDLAIADVLTIAHEIATLRYRAKDGESQPDEVFGQLFNLKWAEELCDTYKVCRDDPQRLKLQPKPEIVYCSSESADRYTELAKNFFTMALDLKKLRCTYHPERYRKNVPRSDSTFQNIIDFLNKFSIQRTYRSKPGLCLQNVLYATSTDLRPWADDVESFECVAKIALSHPFLGKKTSPFLDIMDRSFRPESNALAWCLGRVAQHGSNPDLADPFSSLLELIMFGKDNQNSRNIVHAFSVPYALSLSQYTLQRDSRLEVLLVQKLVEKMLMGHLQRVEGQKVSSVRDIETQCSISVQEVQIRNVEKEENMGGDNRKSQKDNISTMAKVASLKEDKAESDGNKVDTDGVETESKRSKASTEDRKGEDRRSEAVPSSGKGFTKTATSSNEKRKRPLKPSPSRKREKKPKATKQTS
ncbi:hypothetical protein TWF106_006452 [Orbilia oligospora]|uniref:Uncharacterized protein n=1 Tax=Orbilia oligospora TaxID=2813651 RepID=A0A7C8QPS6_ORBOL|nr:hypothetical protein TWF106_006452 [Orbilia oligospora]